MTPPCIYHFFDSKGFKYATWCGTVAVILGASKCFASNYFAIELAGRSPLLQIENVDNLIKVRKFPCLYSIQEAESHSDNLLIIDWK